MKRVLSLFFVAICLVIFSNDIKAQGFKVGADVVSRYVWRGSDYSNSPNIQPYLSYEMHGFEIGYWGSYSFTMNYQETDLYLAYTLKDMASFLVTDYFFPRADSISINNKYFDYNSETTTHILEASAKFLGTEKIPIQLLLSYNFYGWDKDKSFYAELGYGGTVKDIDYTVFAGATTGKGIYMPDGSDGFSVVNLGVSACKKIKVSEKWTLPLMSTLVFNPQAQNVYIVFSLML